MFLSYSVSKHKSSHRQYGLMDMNMINKFASQAIHVGTQDLTDYYKPTNFCVINFCDFCVKIFIKICKK